MFPKRFALTGGIIMLAIGIISLIPQMVGSIQGLPALNLEQSYGLFLGLFPMNILNKVTLIVFGLAGIYSASKKFTDLPASIKFSRYVFGVMGALAILGIIPQTNTLFGYVPLFGNEVWAHAAFAVLGAYFGFALTARVPNQKIADKKFTTPVHGLR
ncbi:MAG: DUF4383 domain-containing protein [Bdellovibrio sp.]|nr:DUF4383 domain-containing protein [Bdellovibrio sp.]